MFNKVIQLLNLALEIGFEIKLWSSLNQAPLSSFRWSWKLFSWILGLEVIAQAPCSPRIIIISSLVCVFSLKRWSIRAATHACESRFFFSHHLLLLHTPRREPNSVPTARPDPAAAAAHSQNPLLSALALTPATELLSAGVVVAPPLRPAASGSRDLTLCWNPRRVWYYSCCPYLAVSVAVRGVRVLAHRCGIVDPSGWDLSPSVHPHDLRGEFGVVLPPLRVGRLGLVLSCVCCCTSLEEAAAACCLFSRGWPWNPESPFCFRLALLIWVLVFSYLWLRETKPKQRSCTFPLLYLP